MSTANFQGERGHKRRDRYLHFNTNKKNSICLIMTKEHFVLPYIFIANPSLVYQFTMKTYPLSDG